MSNLLLAGLRPVVLLLGLVCAFPGMQRATAQSGSVAGTVVDAESGETLIGVNLVVQGTLSGASTDIDGSFQIAGLEPGSYTLEISYVGYNRHTVNGVEVLAGRTARIDVELEPESIGMDEIVVEARALRNNEAVLLRDRQKAAGVSDAISAEAISRSGSGDAADAMTRVTGASVVGGKYVYIRGLGERYSSTHLNGSELPSADPDKKAFQLDLFPSGLLDNIVTLKTFTPDKPGNFSGGLVNVGTKDFPEALTVQLSSSASYNDQVTGADGFILYPGGDTDWLGYDDGTRGIPGLLADPGVEIPSEIEARFDPEKAARLDALSRAFNPVMAPALHAAGPNRSASFALGNQALLLKRPLGFTASLNYSRRYAFYGDGEIGRWELVGAELDNVDALAPVRVFDDVKGSQETNLGGLATLSYKPHNNHKLSGTYLRTQSGESQARSLEGFWVDLNENSTYQTRVLGYKERALESYQFRGEHFLPALGASTVEWKASLTDNRQDEPDLRYFTNHYTVRASGDTLYQSPASLYPAPARFFRNLEEANRNYQLDLSLPFRQWNGFGARLKLGGFYLDVDRDFRERRFEYEEAPGFSYQQFGGDETAFFSASGIIGERSNGRPIFGNYIVDRSAAKNNYTGARTIRAAYAMLDLPLTRGLRFIGGARLETTDMSTLSADPGQPEGRLDNRDVLPSVNLVYEVAPGMNLRGAFTRTLARPTFRELAPYSTFDFAGDFVYEGNPALRRTLIDNADLRWEWFLRPGEIVAVSGFYKRFTNPIERVILTSVGNNSMSSQNVSEGRVLGAELELRKRLDTVSPLLASFQVGGNLSLVHSAVDIPEEELFVIRAADPDASTTRKLQGQSPYLVNVDVAYENGARGTVVGLYYNVFGERLTVVTEGAAPDVFERPRSTLDLIASQRVFERFYLKLSAKNLFNQDVLQAQSFKGTHYVYQRYRLGRTFSVNASFKL